MSRTRAAALAVVLVLAAGCSSGSDAASEDDATTTTTEAPATERGAAPTCDQGATVEEVDAAAVAGSESDLDVTMPDGTVVRAHWFPAPTDEPVPTVLMGPGWGLSGDTSTEGAPIFGALSIGAMNDEGYNVLTWDPRGFGESTGEATVNFPDNEGRDVQVLLDWVATQPEALTDAAGDPRVGMVGASYGGGIQLTLAGIDCRVDALVPNMAWHSLETSLYRNETVKAGWASALVGAAATAELDPHITSAADTGISSGVLSDEDHQWFLDRGPGDLVDAIRAPTLLLQGTVDTLFTLQEGVTNFEALQANDVPVAMLWYCGGHGTCRTEPGDESVLGDRAFAWLDAHLRGATDADVGPVVDVIDQDGARWVGDDYPEPDGAIDASGDGGTLALTADSVAGPLPAGSSSDVLAGFVSGFTPDRADVAVELAVEVDAEALVLGRPGLALTYSGTSPDGPEPTRLFAQLVDEATGVVVGNQVTPVPVELDGEEHTVEVDLEVVAQHVRPGDRLTLQLVATTPAYATPRLGGSVTVSAIDLSLPTTSALTPA